MCCPLCYTVPCFYMQLKTFHLIHDYYYSGEKLWECTKCPCSDFHVKRQNVEQIVSSEQTLYRISNSINLIHSRHKDTHKHTDRPQYHIYLVIFIWTVLILFIYILRAVDVLKDACRHIEFIITIVMYSMILSGAQTIQTQMNFIRVWIRDDYMMGMFYQPNIGKRNICMEHNDEEKLLVATSSIENLCSNSFVFCSFSFRIHFNIKDPGL